MSFRCCSTRAPGIAALLSAALLVSGCGGTSEVPLSITVPSSPTGYAGVAFGGYVFGGTSPVAGASVEIFSTGTTGAGSASNALLSAALTTDATGAFSVPSGYTCPSSSSQLFLVARGGSVGVAQTANPAIVLLLALGPCGSVASGAKVAVDEVSTVAGVWALTQFLGPAGALGASATNATGLANAAQTATALLSAARGTPGLPAGSAIPVTKMNALASLLHLCIANASSAGCTALLSLTTAAGGATPGDTLEAARDLALRPGANAAALFALLPAAPAFAPALATAPADWTLSVTYGGGGMNAPGALGLDSAGDVWVASYFNVLSKFSPVGSALFPAGLSGSGLGSSYGLAIDANDDVWVTNENSDGAVNGARGSVAKFSGGGQPLSGATGFSAGGINFPVGIAIDPNGTVWVVNYGNASVTLLDGSGNPLSGASGYPATGSAFPVAVALDVAHNGWIGDQNDGIVTSIAADGSRIRNYSCCSGSAGLAIDQAGATWVANFYGSNVSRIANGQTTVFNGGGLNRPQGIAIDGAGRVWVTSYAGAGIAQLAGSAEAQPGQVLSPAPGWGADGSVSGAFALAIDASGNLWISGSNDNSLREIIGLAAPVKTPLLGPPRVP